MGRPKIGVGRRIVVPLDVMDGLRLIAAHRGEPVSVVMRDALQEYTRKHLRRMGRRAA
ncbi:MAG: hypothetical protein KC492_25250 [Myxococcales bacterium]|nr:hypothetical protein [Myxococcales bacterium]